MIAIAAVLYQCAPAPEKATPPPEQAATLPEPGIQCEKDFYVFVDISRTMSTKDERSGKIPLVEFATATKGVLDSLVGKSDHVVLYAFSQDVYTLASTHPDISASPDYKAKLDALSDKNAKRLKKSVRSIVTDDKELQFTDFRRVCDKLRDVSHGDTQKYFIVASDFYHDRDNWRCMPDAHADAAIADDLQYMRHKMETVKAHAGGLMAHLVPLAQRSPCSGDLANNVIANFKLAFTLPKTNTVDALDNPADDIREAFADAPEPVVTGGVGKAGMITFSVQNQNPFSIKLQKAELIDNEKRTHILSEISPDKDIACGKEYSFDLSTEKGREIKSVLARVTYDIGQSDSKKPILIDSIDFSTFQATYIPALLGKGTLILDVTFTDHLRDTRKLAITIGHTTETFEITPSGGVEQRLAMPFEVKESDKKNASAALIPVKLSLENGRISREGVEPEDGKTPARQTPWSLARISDKLVAVMSNIAGAVGLIVVLVKGGQGLKRVLIAFVSLLLIAVNFLPLDVHDWLHGALQIALFWAFICGLSAGLATWGFLILFIWGRFWEPRLVTTGLAADLRKKAWRWIAYSAIAGAAAALLAHPFSFEFVVNHPL